jgi:phosphoglycolate phosphatase-like HAD superfamily hydrolase
MRLLITDLDNTLYDWVTFFARSFQAMTDSLSCLLSVERSVLFSEFKAIHQEDGSSEVPFAALRLPSVTQRFPGMSRTDVARALEPAFAAFNASRREHLRLYRGVSETLAQLTATGVIVVGHTEAVAVNAYYRVVVLDIERFFQRLYALEGRVDPHPEPDRPKRLPEPSPEFLRVLPASDRKPNPAVLLDICRREGFAPADACYVGDSLVRDVSMAGTAGVKAVWARYGTLYDRGLWETLVSITHWTDADVAREVELRKQYANIAPDVVIDSFSDILAVFGLDTHICPLATG